MSSRIKELCIRAEAIDADSSATAHHIHHSTLSVVYQWAGVMQARKPMMDRAIRQSRHSMETFLSKHLLQVPPECCEALDLIPSEGTLEDILLAAPSSGQTSMLQGKQG